MRPWRCLSFELEGRTLDLLVPDDAQAMAWCATAHIVTAEQGPPNMFVHLV